ncbi:hypothetical protein JOD97_004614 [Duganella sp. 1411]|uniref:hypothetical protein n=1 Tax=Duganella sp. 1411 TaxID=2806572 RepID=UPI001AEA4EE5|nr:hypothetical protein [Duganella sp. 1411]MBP1206538.1 hypothetical protein [Duganella sp. 1411]
MITLFCARRALVCAAMSATALLLGACNTPYRPPLFVEPDPVFPGLIDLAARADGKGADVLLVHGMCTHDAKWAPKAVAQMTQALTAATTSPEAGPAAGAAGEVPRVQIVPSTVRTPAGTLRFAAMIWSPLTVPLKRQLCYDQTNKLAICAGEPPYPFTRARLNARLKDVLVDDCLADAVVYQGVSRDAIQRRMREAILQVLTASDGPSDQPLMVVSSSLGSKILFDTLLRMTEEEPGARASRLALRAVERLRFLVMAGNQIPLLSLADQQIGDADTARRLVPSPPDSLQLLLQKRSAGKRLPVAGPGLTLVAFTDPNDLLSYTLPAERYAGDDVAVYNIMVSNAPTWLGLLARPDQAHLDYLDNPDVGRLIACGRPASAHCKRE